MTASKPMQEKLRELKAHHQALKHGTEGSMIRMLSIIQMYQQTHLSNTGEIEELRSQVSVLKSENSRLSYNLNDARQTIASDSDRIRELENEVDGYRKIIEVLKHLINDGDSNVAKALGENERRLLEMASTNRQSRTNRNSKTPVAAYERSREYLLNKSALSDSDSSSTAGPTRRSKRRSSLPLVEETPKPNKYVRYGSPVATSCSSLDSAANPTPSVPKQRHAFHKKTLLRAEDCHVCHKKVRFGTEVNKCKACKFICHTSCKVEAVTTECNASASTAVASRSIGPLSKFTPPNAPYIPKILAVIIQEVEERGKNETGIYRIPGTHRTVQDIMSQIAAGKVPYLSGHEIHTVCSVLKEFVRRLEEPIVTTRLHSKFMSAAECTNSAEATSAVKNLVASLPEINRDSLAFLMLHLKRVSTWKACSMGIENLCKIFGPTIIRHAQRSDEDNQADLMRESQLHPVVMRRLFDIPEHFWSQFLSGSHSAAAQHETDSTGSDSDRNPAATMKTPGVMRTIREHGGGSGVTPYESTSEESDTPVRGRYGPDSSVAHRTRYRYPQFAKSANKSYFSSPLVTPRKQ